MIVHNYRYLPPAQKQKFKLKQIDKKKTATLLSFFVGLLAVTLLIRGVTFALQNKPVEAAIKNESSVQPTEVLGLNNCDNLKPNELKLDISNDFVLKKYKNSKLTATSSISDKTEQITNFNYEIVNKDLSFGGDKTDKSYKAEINTDSLEPGDYSIQAVATTPCREIKSEAKKFSLSYPLFVVWSMDWEGYDVKDTYLNTIASISSKYKLPITEMYNPRIYTTGSITQSRKDFLTNWIKTRITAGDEVGLHLHMWDDLVRAAGVQPKNEPNWSGANNGYDTVFSTYDEEESKKIISWGLAKMNEIGFKDIKSFRAGGWEMSPDNLKALDDLNIALDTSGRTKHNLGTKLIPSKWDLQPDTKPYHPSKNNINSDNGDKLKVWEFPDNGADSYQYTAAQLKDRFIKNYNNLMKEPQVVTYLSHPHWFNVDQPKIEELFTYISQFKYEDKKGPVVYITLREALDYWNKL